MMNTPKEILRIDFQENDAAPAGAAGGAIVPGYDGTGAFFADNRFGEPAKDWLRLAAPEGIDLTRDNFTLLFWCRMLHGGSAEWLEKAQQAQPGTGLRVEQAKGGGVLFATAAMPGSGAAAVMLPQKAYLAAGIVDDDGMYFDTDGIWQPQDCRWHQLALACDRGGFFRIYVDDVLQGEVDISSAAGKAVGENVLSIGADTSGRYGIAKTYFQWIRLYQGLLTETEIAEHFQVRRLSGLLFEASRRMEHLGREYTEEMKSALRAAISEAKSDGDYGRFRNAYESFLSAPQAQARFTAALLGDPHIIQPGDDRSQAVETLIEDTLASGVRPDVLLSVGDNGNNSSYETGRNTFGVFADLTERCAPPWQLIACHGNHDTMYNNERENYLEGIRAYWEGLQPFLTGKYRKDGTILDEAYRDVCEKYLAEKADHAGCSYGVTVCGTHILVLNTDYFDQTGNARAVWSLAGNDLDPIRHGVLFYDGTFRWMEHMLDTYSQDGGPIFVLCHFPFIDTVPLSYYREINIEDNSIGRQDPQIRALLGRYPIFYICGHLHSGLGVSGPVNVVSREGAFPEISVSSMHAVDRGYRSIPAGWHLFLYDDEIVLRARDYAAHEWLTAYDEVIPLRKSD